MCVFLPELFSIISHLTPHYLLLTRPFTPYCFSADHTGLSSTTVTETWELIMGGAASLLDVTGKGTQI